LGTGGQIRYGFHFPWLATFEPNNFVFSVRFEYFQLQVRFSNRAERRGFGSVRFEYRTVRNVTNENTVRRLGFEVGAAQRDSTVRGLVRLTADC